MHRQLLSAAIVITLILMIVGSFSMGPPVRQPVRPRSVNQPFSVNHPFVVRNWSAAHHSLPVARLEEVRVRRCISEDGVETTTYPDGDGWVNCSSHGDQLPGRQLLMGTKRKEGCTTEALLCTRVGTVSTEKRTRVGTVPTEKLCSVYLLAYLSEPMHGTLSHTAAGGVFRKLTPMPPAADLGSEHGASRATWARLMCTESVPPDHAAANLVRAKTVEAVRADVHGETPHLGTYTKDAAAGLRQERQPVGVILTCAAI